MTRIPCPSESWDDYYASEEAKAELEAEHAERRKNGQTISGFIAHIGCGTALSENLRAIDKHNLEHVWLVVRTGEDSVERLYYHLNREYLNSFDHDRLVEAVGAGCIAWDGSDWEYSNEITLEPEDSLAAAVDAVRADVHDAYTSYYVDVLWERSYEVGVDLQVIEEDIGSDAWIQAAEDLIDAA